MQEGTPGDDATTDLNASLQADIEAMRSRLTRRSQAAVLS